jgi:ParB family chromosome partitioning protein
MSKVSPTPFQRDISPTHEKRLRGVIERMGRFIDPVVVVTPKPGVYWTPNGNHRRVALEEIGASYIPAILIPEIEVAYQILAMNTEKAHNLKEKSLEVARM